MSVFRPETLICPVCGHRNTETVALSLHGSHVPEIVQSIVDGTFQCFTCARCDLPYRADGPLIYIDFERKRWIGEFPASMEPDWAAGLEQQPLDAFRRSVIDLAPAFLRAEADGFAIRAVFGLEALAEKIRLFDAGYDDRLVEVAKLQTMLRVGAVFAPSGAPAASWGWRPMRSRWACGSRRTTPRTDRRSRASVTIDATDRGGARRRRGVASGAERAVGRALRRPRPVVPRRPALGVRRPPPRHGCCLALSRTAIDRPADLSRPGRSRARGRPRGARACASGRASSSPWCSTTCRPRPSSRAHSRHADGDGVRRSGTRPGGDPPFDDLGDELDPGDVELLGDAPEVRVAKAPRPTRRSTAATTGPGATTAGTPRSRGASCASGVARRSIERRTDAIVATRPSRRASPRSGRPWCRSGSGSARCSHRARRPRRRCAGRAGPWPA